jgi:hypothetical protein
MFQTRRHILKSNARLKTFTSPTGEVADLPANRDACPVDTRSVAGM